jgi:GH25 family lysozyme M1 (1,4-beta-N-acetylmuramidase)
MLGVDISNANGTVDWNALVVQDVDFAFVKASEGASFADGFLRQNRQNAQAAGIPVGLYHFARPALNGPLSEADHFCNTVGSLWKNELRPVLDLEAEGGTPDWARSFLNAVEQRLNVRPMLYSYPSYLDGLAQKRNYEYLSQWPLWLAEYGPVNDGTEHPIAWGRKDDFRIACHQYTSKGTIQGVTGLLDLNSAVLMNDLRESGDYIIWRDWVVDGKPDPRPKGIPTTIPKRWTDLFVTDTTPALVAQLRSELALSQDTLKSVLGERDTLSEIVSKVRQAVDI